MIETTKECIYPPNMIHNKQISYTLLLKKPSFTKINFCDVINENLWLN